MPPKRKLVEFDPKVGNDLANFHDRFGHLRSDAQLKVRRMLKRRALETIKQGRNTKYDMEFDRVLKNELKRTGKWQPERFSLEPRKTIIAGKTLTLQNFKSYMKDLIYKKTGKRTTFDQLVGQDKKEVTRVASRMFTRVFFSQGSPYEKYAFDAEVQSQVKKILNLIDPKGKPANATPVLFLNDPRTVTKKYIEEITNYTGIKVDLREAKSK